MGASESKRPHHPRKGQSYTPEQKRDTYAFRVIKDGYETIEGVTDALRTAGLESSQLIVGVDFTKSNEWTGKRSFNGRCLHHTGDDGPNPYEQAMSIIARTLHSFDDDHLIPCYGFGDYTTGDRQVFSFYNGNVPAQGLEMAVSRYRQISSLVRLAGPTSFGPLIRQALRDVVASGNQYHILLILADGQVTPTCTEDTVAAIVEASKYPMSIIMVGVGDGPWDTMVAFDDALPVRKFDNFQFVNFTLRMEQASVYQGHAKKEAHFALNALMEIPEQYKAVQTLSLMGSRARVPRLDTRQQLVTSPPPEVLAIDDAYYGGMASTAPPFGGATAPPAAW